MAASHPETELIAYVRGELSADERAQLDAHLEGCAECRQVVKAASAILSQLPRLVGRMGEPDWTEFRRELRRELRAAEASSERTRGRWWADVQRLITELAPTATTTGALAGVMLALAIVIYSGVAGPYSPGVDQLELQPELSSTDMGLLANYYMVEDLDLLENYDVIEHLDELGHGDRRTNETPS